MKTTTLRGTMLGTLEGGPSIWRTKPGRPRSHRRSRRGLRRTPDGRPVAEVIDDPSPRVYLSSRRIAPTHGKPMSSTTLMVTIDQTGKVVIEVAGASGPACTLLTKEFEEALGGEILERRHLDAYYEEDGQERLHLGRGE